MVASLTSYHIHTVRMPASPRVSLRKRNAATPERATRPLLLVADVPPSATRHVLFRLLSACHKSPKDDGVVDARPTRSSDSFQSTPEALQRSVVATHLLRLSRAALEQFRPRVRVEAHVLRGLPAGGSGRRGEGEREQRDERQRQRAAGLHGGADAVRTGSCRLTLRFSAGWRRAKDLAAKC